MFKVYWSDLQDKAMGKSFEDMTEALNFMQELRTVYDRKFVTMASENPNQVGKMGVDSVEEGLLPDGSKYTWNKAGRIGSTRR